MKQDRRTRVITISAYFILVIAVLGFIGFILGKKDYSLSQNEFAHKFGASFMTMNNPFFEVINNSIKTTVEANGDILITRNPALDSDRQIEQINDLIDEGIEALFVAPVDYEKIIPVIKKAKEKGIIIIFVDTESYEDDIADGIVVSDNYLAGKLCADYMMKNSSAARIVICEHPRTKSSNDRVNGFMDAISEHDKYQIVGSVNSEGQLELAMPAMKEVIEKKIEFDTVFSINDLSALGTMAALKDAGMLSKVSVLGVDGSPEAKAMIKEGLMTATSAQYPSKIGENAINQLYSILNGQEYEKKILVPVQLITSDNVDEYGTANWQ